MIKGILATIEPVGGGASIDTAENRTCDVCTLALKLGNLSFIEKNPLPWLHRVTQGPDIALSSILIN